MIQQEPLGKWLDYGKEWNKSLKQYILARDGHACVLCGMTDKQHRENMSKRAPWLFEYLRTMRTILYIHHIDEDKVNTVPLNLVTLCSQCHHKKGVHGGNGEMRAKLSLIAQQNVIIHRNE